jgi:hypothetical protein
MQVNTFLSGFILNVEATLLFSVLLRVLNFLLSYPVIYPLSSVLDPDSIKSLYRDSNSESGCGSRREKMTHQKKGRNFMF